MEKLAESKKVSINNSENTNNHITCKSSKNSIGGGNNKSTLDNNIHDNNNGALAIQSDNLSAPRGTQFFKTKLCPFLSKGKCINGESCKYAHHHFELRVAPDLRCTKLCETFIKGEECMREGCTFAHSREDLRTSHMAFYKINLCNFYKKGKCLNGASCRFAHGISELRGQLPAKKEKKKRNKKSKAKIEKTENKTSCETNDESDDKGEDNEIGDDEKEESGIENEEDIKERAEVNEHLDFISEKIDVDGKKIKNSEDEINEFKLKDSSEDNNVCRNVISEVENKDVQSANCADSINYIDLNSYEAKRETEGHDSKKRLCAIDHDIDRCHDSSNLLYSSNSCLSPLMSRKSQSTHTEKIFTSTRKWAEIEDDDDDLCFLFGGLYNSGKNYDAELKGEEGNNEKTHVHNINNNDNGVEIIQKSYSIDLYDNAKNVNMTSPTKLSTLSSTHVSPSNSLTCSAHTITPRSIFLLTSTPLSTTSCNSSPQSFSKMKNATDKKVVDEKHKTNNSCSPVLISQNNDGHCTAEETTCFFAAKENEVFTTNDNCESYSCDRIGETLTTALHESSDHNFLSSSAPSSPLSSTNEKNSVQSKLSKSLDSNESTHKTFSFLSETMNTNNNVNAYNNNSMQKLRNLFLTGTPNASSVRSSCVQAPPPPPDNTLYSLKKYNRHSNATFYPPPPPTASNNSNDNSLRKKKDHGHNNMCPNSSNTTRKSSLLITSPLSVPPPPPSNPTNNYYNPLCSSTSTYNMTSSTSSTSSASSLDNDNTITISTNVTDTNALYGSSHYNNVFKSETSVDNTYAYMATTTSSINSTTNHILPTTVQTPYLSTFSLPPHYTNVSFAGGNFFSSCPDFCSSSQANFITPHIYMQPQHSAASYLYGHANISTSPSTDNNNNIVNNVSTCSRATIVENENNQFSKNALPDACISSNNPFFPNQNWLALQLSMTTQLLQGNEAELKGLWKLCWSAQYED